MNTRKNIIVFYTVFFMVSCLISVYIDIRPLKYYGTILPPLQWETFENIRFFSLLCKGILACHILYFLLSITKKDIDNFPLLITKVTKLSIFPLFLILLIALNTIGAFSYFSNKAQYHTLYEAYYVQADAVPIIPPIQKKNAIVLVVESLELTFSDEEVFPKGLISGVMRLREKHLYFDTFVQAYGQGFTQGFVVGATAGVPLIYNSGGYANRLAEISPSFLANTPSIADILSKYNYSTLFLKGSNLRFSGTDTYVQSHGFMEYFGILELEESYGKRAMNDWGYNDTTLLAILQEKVTEMNMRGKPFFAFTILSDNHAGSQIVEHSPHGNPFYDNAYSTTQAVSKFVEWFEQQDFYENTTLIILGDHTHMGANTELRSSKKYPHRPIFNVFINAHIRNSNALQNKERTFMAVDIFPTIMEAMGFSIEGGKLGLGTSLFSEKPSLLEKIGIEHFNEEIIKENVIYQSLW